MKLVERSRWIVLVMIIMMVMEMVEMMIESKISIPLIVSRLFYLDVHVVVHVNGKISFPIVAIGSLSFACSSRSRSRSSSRERSKKKYV